MLQSLPHLQESDERPLEALLAQFQHGNPDDYYLAVSDGSWDANEQTSFAEVYAEYQRFFAQAAARLTQILGEPAYRGHHDDAAFPEWAHGNEVVVWSDHNHSLWLRIEHEDRECPILVVLAPTPE
ncbi:hypothetical protein NA78x_000064 [Anatilimnocola sp. NA78]|uniref:hypothetical protein n=1 Tax=Anatilimnocola sp. NA78 TaxID=3415683 RepID=UPI003CE4D22A